MVEDEKTEHPAPNGRTATPAQDQAAGAQSSGPLADVHAYIGRQLRAVYDDVAKQPIPDRFLALMQQLEEKGVG